MVSCMFTLKEKDSNAYLSDFSQLMVNMTWTTAQDFDLFAVYETKSGSRNIVYYDTPGDLNDFPYMKLSGDAGVDEQAGDNVESLTIVDLSQMKYVWLCCWDYNKVTSGTPISFGNSDLKIAVMDDTGQNFEVPMASFDNGNVVCIATIDNSSPISTKLHNSSKVSTLRGLDPESLMSFLLT